MWKRALRPSEQREEERLEAIIQGLVLSLTPDILSWKVTNGLYATYKGYKLLTNVHSSSQEWTWIWKCIASTNIKYFF